MSICEVEDCGRTTIARGFCTKHYQRWKKFGSPLIVLRDREITTEERFWVKVDKNGPVPSYAPHLGSCWIWTAALAEGYGVFSVENRQRRAHILAWMWAKGEIPEGCELDHLCRVRRCVRPDHLEAVTHWVNVARGVSPHGYNIRKTHCPQGHLYDEENTYLGPRGQRICRKCQSRRCREWYQRQRASFI